MFKTSKQHCISMYSRKQDKNKNLVSNYTVQLTSQKLTTWTTDKLEWGETKLVNMSGL